MVDLAVENKISAYINSNPEIKDLSRDKIVSIMLESGALSESEAGSWAKNISDTTKTTSTQFRNSAFEGSFDKSNNGILGWVGNGSSAQTQNVKIQEVTPQEVKEHAVESIQSNVIEGLNLFLAKKQEQGAISKFYNSTKELFDAELAGTRVHRVISQEKLGSELLDKANENTLTEKEYLEAKIDLAAQLLPQIKDGEVKSRITKGILTLGGSEVFAAKSNAEKERLVAEMELQYLKKALAELTPEQLNEFIDVVTSMSDEEYNEKAHKATENLIEGKINKELAQNQPKSPDSLSIRLNFVNPNSIEAKLQTKEAYRLLKFEEVFERERGLEYNREAILDYAEKEANMTFLLAMANRNSEIKNILKDATVVVDGNNKHGAPDSRFIEPCENRLENALITALNKLYGGDEEKINETLKELSGNENISLTRGENQFGTESQMIDCGMFGKGMKGYNLVLISKNLQAKLDANFEKALDGKTFEEVQQETTDAYNLAYGEKNGTKLANTFIESQEEGVQTIKGIVQGAGMVVLIGGQFVPVLGQFALAGIATATAGGAAIQTIESATQQGGITKEDAKMIGEELATSIALMGSGMTIGRASTIAYGKLVPQIEQFAGKKVSNLALSNFLASNSKIIAKASEVGMDTTLSLIADYGITGQVDLSGEGRAQLIPIIAGLIKAKGRGGAYLNNDFQHAASMIKNTPQTNTPTTAVKPEVFEAADTDLREIHKIDLEAFAEIDPVSINFNKYKADLETNGISTYVIKDKDGKLTGYMMLEPVKDGELYINSIGVPKELRNTRASYDALQQIQEHITQIAKEQNLEKVSLHVDAENKALVKMYEKYGFEIKETEKGYEANGNDAHYMELDVKKQLAKLEKPNSEVKSEVETKVEPEQLPKAEVAPKKIMSAEEFEIEKAKLNEKMLSEKHFSEEDIREIIKHTEQENLAFAKQLYEDKIFGADEINALCVSTLERNTSPKNINERIEAYNTLKKGDGFDDTRRLYTIISRTKPENIEIAKHLYDSMHHNDQVKAYLDNTNYENIELAKLLAKDTNYNEDMIKNILENTDEYNIKEKVEIYNELKEYSVDYDAQYNALRFANNRNIDLVRKILGDKELIPHMSSILYLGKDWNLSLAKQLCNNNDFPKNEIPRILSQTTANTTGLAKEFCAIKDFPKNLIFDILESARGLDVDFVKEVCLNENLPYNKIKSTLGCIREDNMDFAKTLLADENFPTQKIDTILSNATGDNLKLVTDTYELLKAKNLDGETTYSILSQVNQHNGALVKTLLSDEGFPQGEVADILGNTGVNNLKLVELLYADKEFPPTNIKLILDKYYQNPSKVDAQIEIYKTLKEAKVLSEDGITRIINNTTAENIELAKIFATDTRYSRADASNILSNTNAGNLPLAKELCAENRLPANKLNHILSNTNSDNIDFARMLIADKNCPQEKIGEILGYVNKDNSEFAGMLYADNVDLHFMYDILAKTKSYNNELAKQLYEDADFPNKRISDVLYNTDRGLGTGIEKDLWLGKYKTQTKELISHLEKNLEKLQAADEAELTMDNIYKLITNQRIGVHKLLGVVDLGVIKHTTEMKYKGMENFFASAANLGKLSSVNIALLKDRLAQLPHPEQKIEKLQMLSAIAAKVDNDEMTNIINLIQSPKTSEVQIKQVEAIFSNGKPYEQQIEQFIKEFNVAQNRIPQIQKYLENAQLSEKFTTPPPIEKQIEVLNKKLESVVNNDKIPQDKKDTFVQTIQSQINELKTNPQNFTRARINDTAIKPLSSQIESHINLPNHTQAFNNKMKTLLYKQLDIETTPELFNAIDYDPKYFANLFSANSDFKREFSKLMDLIKQNPDKPLSQIREAISENQQTRQLFEKNGLDYENWIKFNKDSKHDFVIEVNVEKNRQAALNNLKSELVNTDFNKISDDFYSTLRTRFKEAGLLHSAAENDMDTSITAFRDNLSVKDMQKIVEIVEVETNAQLMSGMTKEGCENQLAQILDHMEIHKKNIKSLENLKNNREELTVRLSDDDDIGRNIFLGNHVGCCTSVQNSNAFAAPQHLMNSYVRGFEIVDKGGNSMGNSMCYFAKVDGKTTFIIDSFEANGKLGAAPEVTNAIIDYAKQVCKEMGQPDANIMFGPNYNKINFDRCLRTNNHTVEIIGRAPESTYIDAIGGFANINIAHKDRTMYEIMDL